MQNETQKPSSRLKTARRAFSYIGFALILWIALEYAVLWLEKQALAYAYPAGDCPPWLSILLSYGALYCLVFPLVLLFLRRLPAAPPEKGKISARSFFVFLPIMLTLSYVGSLVGNLVASLFESGFGFAPTDPTESLLGYNPILTALLAVIVGPLVEEWLFRKAILDRTRAYGEKLALIFSSLLFAFFHINLYQFFYAFLIGLVLGYVYLRTGKVSVTYVLHALFNLIGCLIPILLMRMDGYSDFTAAQTVEEQLAVFSAHPGTMAAAAAYGLAELSLVILGCVLLGLYRKKIFFKQSECQLPPDTEGSAAFVNLGVIAYIILATLLSFLAR